MAEVVVHPHDDRDEALRARKRRRRHKDVTKQTISGNWLQLKGAFELHCQRTQMDGIMICVERPDADRNMKVSRPIHVSSGVHVVVPDDLKACVDAASVLVSRRTSSQEALDNSELTRQDLMRTVEVLLTQEDVKRSASYESKKTALRTLHFQGKLRPEWFSMFGVPVKALSDMRVDELKNVINKILVSREVNVDERVNVVLRSRGTYWTPFPLGLPPQCTEKYWEDIFVSAVDKRKNVAPLVILSGKKRVLSEVYATLCRSSRLLCLQHDGSLNSNSSGNDRRVNLSDAANVWREKGVEVISATNVGVLWIDNVTEELLERVDERLSEVFLSDFRYAGWIVIGTQDGEVRTEESMPHFSCARCIQICGDDDVDTVSS